MHRCVSQKRTKPPTTVNCDVKRREGHGSVAMAASQSYSVVLVANSVDGMADLPVLILSG